MSNWYTSKFVDENNIKYSCVEQYMMAHKALLFNDVASYDKIMKETNPSKMKKYGKSVVGFDNAIWDKYKYGVVFTGNMYKYEQNPNLKKLLLNTNNCILCEASPYDKIWGIGLRADNINVCDPYYWEGENLLGFALMEVRDKIK